MNAYVGPGDSHFHTIVRRVFQPLAKLAAEKSLAVLVVSHLRKHDGAAIQRAAGSMGFVAAARAVWTVARDPIQPDRHLFLPLKNNFVPETAGLAYTIKSTPPLLRIGESPWRGEACCSAPAIQWVNDSVTISATEALSPDKKSRGPEPAELKLAMDYLRQELTTGPKSAFSMLLGCTNSGFSDRTLRRALVALGGGTRKLGPSGDWQWYLPECDWNQFPESGTYGSDPTQPSAFPSQPSRSGAWENLAPSGDFDGLNEETWPLPGAPTEVAIPSSEELTLEQIHLPVQTPSPAPVTPIGPAEQPEFAPILTIHDIDQFIRDLRRPKVHKSENPGSAPSLVAELIVDILKKSWFPDESHCRDP